METTSSVATLRIKRHDALCDTVFHALIVDNSGCRCEQCCSSDINSRPGDVFHPDFQQGRPAYFDITIRNSLQSSYIRLSAREAGAAALAGESEKDDRHQEAVERTGCMFFPLAVETLGVWSPNSLETLKIIARRTILSTGKTVSKAISNLHQQLSVRLWQYNARMPE